MIDYWKDLVPLKSTDGGRGAILFRCIHALMSLQVQNLIKRSVDHLHGALSVYKVCGRIECHPFMAVNVCLDDAVYVFITAAEYVFNLL